MPAELDNISPEMDQPTPVAAPQDDVIGTHDQEVDREGAMAKADLHKLATYADKLQSRLQDEDQLEGWVQAKITKAADYISSVYHYLEYEMKFSDYKHHLDNAEETGALSESQIATLKSKLTEAKMKIKELKKAQVEKTKSKEEKVDEGILSGGDRPCTECGGTGMVYEEPKAIPDHVKNKVSKYNTLVKATKAAHKRMDANNNGIPDEDEVEEGFDADTKVGAEYTTSKGNKVTKTDKGLKHERPSSTYDDGGDDIASNAKSGKGVKSHAKSQSASEKKEKAPAQKKSKTGTWGMEGGEKFDNRKEESIAEAKPSAGLSKKEKSAVVKDAKAGKDIGKPGKSFDKVAKSAGGGEKGKKIAAAAMWKNVKETVAYVAEKKEATKDLPGKQEKIDVAEPKGKIDGKDMAALRAKKETVKESTEFTRMQDQISRLNRNEHIQLNENSEVNTLRKLTNLFKG
jgi:hypothetical protein